MIAADVASRYNYDKRVLLPVIEAVEWLEQSGLLVGDPDNATPVRLLSLSRRAQTIINADDFSAFRRHHLSAYELLHEDIGTILPLHGACRGRLLRVLMGRPGIRFPIDTLCQGRLRCRRECCLAVSFASMLSRSIILGSGASGRKVL